MVLKITVGGLINALKLVSIPFKRKANYFIAYNFSISSHPQFQTPPPQTQPKH